MTTIRRVSSFQWKFR